MKIKGVVWIETVVYTLIGLTLIGLALAIINPQIDKARERAIIEQSIETLNILDNKIKEIIDFGQGNSRKVEFLISKGNLIVDPEKDEITFVVSNLKTKYSELNLPIKIGSTTIITEQKQKTYTTTAHLNYSKIANLTVGVKKDNKNKKIISSSSKARTLTIINHGLTGENIEININEN